MQVKLSQNKLLLRNMSEQYPVINIDENLSSDGLEDIRNANSIFPPVRKVNCKFSTILSTKSATLNIKKKNKIESKSEFSEERKIKVAIKKMNREIDWFNSQEKKLAKECDQLTKQLKEAKQKKDKDEQNNCRMDIQNCIERMKLIVQGRSGYWNQISELNEKLSTLQNAKI